MNAPYLHQPEARTLVLGLGNPLRGDDGLGPAVLKELKTRAIPTGTRLVDGGTGGLEMLLDWKGAARVLVIDSAHFGGRPGEVRRFDLLDTDITQTNWGAGHAHGLGAAVELASALNVLPEQLILWAVEPESLDELQRLSAAVACAVPVVVEQVLNALESCQPPSASS